MKQGWEIKKLGEVCKIQTGKLDANAKVDDGVYPFFTCDAKPYRINTYAFDDEAILISGNGSLVGHINYYNGKFNAYQRTYVLTQFTSFHIPFLISYLKGFLRSYIIENKKGGCIPYITLPILQNFAIPCPPREEQERIVAELDCLNGVIERKREQLRELDALAQSIFYQMFGDPITNEKRWEVCELQKVSTLLNGRAYKQNELLDEGKYKVLRVGNFFTNSNYYYSDLELEPEKYCDDGDLLFAWSASFGAFIWNGGKVIYHYHIWKVLYDHQKLNIDYYRFLLNTMTSYFMKDVHGIGMVHLTKAGMEQYILPIPPLTLQQQFADKIERIEQQKKLISQSIKEVEDLFNSRMSYYFN